MSIDARIVANEILLRAWDLGFEPTQIDLQKITYFLHGHHLIEHGVPLVETEFEAHQYGPVQRILLESFKDYADQPIRDLAERFNPVTRQKSPLPRVMENSIVATFDTYLLFYLNISSFEMVDMTHASGSPWSKTVENARNAVNIGMRINNDMIRSHFEGVKAA